MRILSTSLKVKTKEYLKHGCCPQVVFIFLNMTIIIMIKGPQNPYISDFIHTVAKK